MKLGVICVPRTVKLAVEMARAAEEAGLWGIGIGDSQVRFMDVYSVSTACLLATSRLAVGPLVTNPVTRHWTVHLAAARALDEVAPGRYVLGMSTGNSSVRSIDRPPAARQALVLDLASLRRELPAGVPVLVAVDGPRMAAVAGQYADGVIIGTGLDAPAVAHLHDAALEARRAAGIEQPLEAWLSVPLQVVEHERDLAFARPRATGVAISMARRALTGRLESRNVPAPFHDVLRERLPRYDMRHHASVDGENPNARLLADHPEVEAYVAARFGILGTPDMCRERLQAVTRDTGISNFWFSSVVADPVRNTQLAGTAFGPLLVRQAAAH